MLKAIIGVALAGIAVGTWLGGRYADRVVAPMTLLGPVMVLSGALAASTDADFADVINLMLGELNASHMGYYPGGRGDRSGPGWLGLTFDPDHRGDGLRVASVVPRGPADLAEGGKLTRLDLAQLGEAGVDIVLYCCSAYRAMNRAAELVYRGLLAQGHQRNLIDIMQTRAKKVRIKTKDTLKQTSDMLDFKQVNGTISFVYTGTVPTLLKLLPSLDIQDINISEPTLEEIFMHYYETEEK